MAALSVVVLVVMFVREFGETKGEVTVIRRLARMKEAAHRQEGLSRIVSIKN